MTTLLDREQLWSILLGLACLGFFVMLLLTVGVVLVLAGTRHARIAFESWLTHDPGALRARLAQLRRHHPDLDNDALVRRIIARQAQKAGLVGALTGAGGIITLPVAIPLDFALSTQLQAGLIHFIAETYSPDQPPDRVQAQTYLILAGNRLAQQAIEASNRVVQVALTRLLTRLLAESIAKSLLKVVPVVGAVIGFVISYAMTRATGELAARWYRGELQLPIRRPRAGSLLTE